MRKIIILCLILITLEGYANDIQISTASIGTSSYRPYSYNRPYRRYTPYYNGRYYNTPKRYYRNGTLTGFSPPVYNYYNYNRGHYNNSYPYYTSKATLGDKIQNFINNKLQKNTNGYYFDPNYNSYVNENYNTNQSPKKIQLFDATIPNGYGYYDGNTNGTTTTSGGATVTIID